MSRMSSGFLVVGVLAFAGLSFTAGRFFIERDSHTCKASSRPIHGHSRAIAMVDGRRRSYCCPACALSEHQQVGEPVEIIELTDYADGQSLRPTESFIVSNSDVNTCLRHEATLSPDKQPMYAHFDRCAPSMLAFRDRRAAQSFAGEHGGQVKLFTELAPRFGR